jgi:uncharacterized protein DUF6065
LEIDIYQLAGDDMFRSNRPDGNGWHWSWAPWQRDWMEETQNKFAYRCLPLTIANQTGWWVYNPVGFTAVWRGEAAPGSVHFLFDSRQDLWSQWINNQFGHGIITWNTPFLVRTRPHGSRLLISGPVNHFKDRVQPLTAVVESDWMVMSFTMNYKITAPNVTIRFDTGEPLFQLIPLSSNLCTDLEQSKVRYMKLTDDPEVAEAYQKWSDGRQRFHQQKKAGDVRPDSWQKDYFQGRDPQGREAPQGHVTRITPPQIDFPPPKR